MQLASDVDRILGRSLDGHAPNRGLDMAAARKMLYEAGFTALRLGDGRKVALDLSYLVELAADEERRAVG